MTTLKIFILISIAIVFLSVLVGVIIYFTTKPGPGSGPGPTPSGPPPGPGPPGPTPSGPPSAQGCPSHKPFSAKSRIGDPGFICDTPWDLKNIKMCEYKWNPDYTAALASNNQPEGADEPCLLPGNKAKLIPGQSLKEAPPAGPDEHGRWTEGGGMCVNTSTTNIGDSSHHLKFTDPFLTGSWKGPGTAQDGWSNSDDAKFIER